MKTRTIKKYKLKKGVKIIIALIFVIGLIIISAHDTKKAVDQCVNAGNSETFCKYQLER